MKCKNSFITNSSSANFILTATRDISRSEFVDFIDKFKIDYCSKFSGSRFTSEVNNITIKYLKESKVIFNYWTSMLNDEVDDMPHFMKYLIINQMMTDAPILSNFKLQIESDS